VIYCMEANLAEAESAWHFGNNVLYYTCSTN
jgi:hypothetical protein